MNKIFMAIESSCDETSIAIMKGKEILSHIISSQVDTHKDFGGVVPEIASRLHEKNFPYIISSALEKSGIRADEIEEICYTSNPGLPGSLQIGKVTALSLGAFLNIPVIPVNHLDGHIYSCANKFDYQYPFLSVIASGGHTQIYKVLGPMDKELMYSTMDDAIGEAYDKVAKLLHLPYPGGPVIDKMYDPSKTTLTFTKSLNSHSDISYSGLKTAINNYISNANNRKESIDKVAVASSFQKIACDYLIRFIKLAHETTKEMPIVLSGGVSANSYLRHSLEANFEQIAYPDLKYTGDNAAMIGWAHYYINR